MGEAFALLEFFDVTSYVRSTSSSVCLSEQVCSNISMFGFWIWTSKCTSIFTLFVLVFQNITNTSNT